MLDLLKGLTDGHKYEIDTEKLKKVYNFNTKLDSDYQVYQSKIIFSREKQNEKTDLTKNEIERNYYSNYKFFREYLTTGFEGEEIKEEIKEIKKLIEYSKKLKESSEKFLNKDNGNINNASKGKKSYFQNFIDLCKLFSVKKEKEKVKNYQEFTLLSEIKTPSDVFSLSINENFLNSKLINFKKKLYKSHYKEEFLSNYCNQHVKVKNSNNIINNSMTENFKLSPEIREKFPVEYIDFLFKNRESELFGNLDSFMSIYRTKKLTNNEKDLYENIYGILSKSNYINFMSFLYSKNEVFKFIYDEFTTKKLSFDESLENMKLSRLASVHTDNLFKNSSYYSVTRDDQKNVKKTNILKNFKDIDELCGHFYFDKIIVNFEKIENKIFNILIQKSKVTKDFKKEIAVNYINSLCSKKVFSLILITKQERFRLVQTIEELESQMMTPLNLKPNEIEENVRNIQFHKIDKKFVNDFLSPKLNDNENFKNYQIYIVEYNNINNSQYYMIGISKENTKRLNLVFQLFELNKNLNERKFFINNNLTIENNKSLGDISSVKGGFSEKSDIKKDSILSKKENPIKKETLSDEKSAKKTIFTINNPTFNNDQLNDSEDNLGDPPQENFLNLYIMKSRNDEKKIDDDFTMLKKKETFLKNEPKTQEIDIKLEDQEIIEKNSNIEIYNFEIDKEFYKFKITTKGIEYIPKKKIETPNNWNLIEFGNLNEIKCVSEVKIPNFKINLTIVLKNKINDRGEIKMIGIDENESNSFCKKLEKYIR